jgi:hypothetical protein
MYLPGFGGCSSLIHIIAQYPKTTLTLGLAAIVTLLASPTGPGAHLGTGQILAGHERQIESEAPAQPNVYDKTGLAFIEVKNLHLSVSTVKYVLQSVGNCSDISAADILASDTLRSEVARIYFYDLVHRYGVQTAKEMYVEQSKNP